MTIQQKIEKLRAMLENPEVSEESKAIIRVALAALEASENMVQ